MMTCRPANEGFTMKRTITAALAGAITAGLASAAATEYSRVFGGVPGYYSAEAETGWSLLSPLNLAAQVFVPDNIAALPDVANCNIGVAATAIAPYDLNRVRDFMTSLSADQFQRIMAAGFAKRGPYVVSNAEKPARADQDGNPGVQTVFTVTDTARNVSVRSSTTQVFSTKGVTTTTCGTGAAAFGAARPLFNAFVDQVAFLNGETAITASLNRNAAASLDGISVSTKIDLETQGDPGAIGIDQLVDSALLALPSDDGKIEN